MLKTKSAIAKTARRKKKRIKLKQLSQNFNSMKKKINNEKINSDRVGILIDLVMKSGVSKPLFFETDRKELFEVMENLKHEKDIESQKEAWFQIIVLALMEVTPIDHTVFNSAVLCIAASSSFIDFTTQYSNCSIGFCIMIHEGGNGYNIYNMTYSVWQEILSNYKSLYNLKLKNIK